MRKSLVSFTHIPTEISMRQLATGNSCEDTPHFDKIFWDPTIQRPLSWKPENKNDFLDSVFTKATTSKIVLVDILACMDSQHLSDQDREFFKELSEKNPGKRWSIIDGGNRIDCNHSFVSNRIAYRVTTESSEYYVAHADSELLYEELPYEMKEAYDSSKLMVEVHTSINKKRYQGLFLRINSGLSPNEHEKLNASCKPQADLARELSSEIIDQVALLKKQTDRCRLNTTISQFVDLMRQLKSQSDKHNIQFDRPNNSKLLELYNMSEVNEKEYKQLLNTFKPIWEVVSDTWVNYMDPKGVQGKLELHMVQELFFAAASLHFQGYKIRNTNAQWLMKYVFKKTEERIGKHVLPDWAPKHVALARYHKKYSSVKARLEYTQSLSLADREDWSLDVLPHELSCVWLEALSDYLNPQSMKFRWKVIYEDITNDIPAWLEEKAGPGTTLITHIPKYASQAQKRRLYKDGKKEENVEYEDLVSGNAEGDHNELPIDRGGSNDESNLHLRLSSENRSKGNKTKDEFEQPALFEDEDYSDVV